MQGYSENRNNARGQTAVQRIAIIAGMAVYIALFCRARVRKTIRVVVIVIIVSIDCFLDTLENTVGKNRCRNNIITCNYIAHQRKEMPS